MLPPHHLPSSRWSLTNRLLMIFSGTDDARGFQQWKEVGRRVKKGSKAIYILCPRMQKSDEETDEENRQLIGFIAAPVFRYEDTQGEPLDIPEYDPPRMPPLMEVATQWGIQVRWTGGIGDAYGYFAPKRKEIILCTHEEATFFHELAHAAHEKVMGKLKGGQHWKQEVVAELTAAVLAHLYGKRANDGGAYRYIRGYAEKEDMDAYRACLAVIGDVGQCLNLILSERENLSAAA